jgi:hypothetical protein
MHEAKEVPPREGGGAAARGGGAAAARGGWCRRRDGVVFLRVQFNCGEFAAIRIGVGRGGTCRGRRAGGRGRGGGMREMPDKEYFYTAVANLLRP